MFDWLLRMTRSPYLLLFVFAAGAVVGGFVLAAALRHGGGGSGIDAARIHDIRLNPNDVTVGQKE